MLEDVKKFINYWWFRYLLITELYMAESWERVAIHFVVLAVFLLFGVLNYYIVLPVTTNLVAFPVSMIRERVL